MFARKNSIRKCIMIIKIIINKPFRGIIDGWSTRYIGLIKILEKENALFIFAPGNTDLLRIQFPESYVCDSTSEHYIKYKCNFLKYIYSIVIKPGKRIFLPGFEYYPEFDILLSDFDNDQYDTGICFGLDGYIHYGKHFGNNPVLCDFCDSIIRHITSYRHETRNLRKKLIHTLDIIHISRIKKMFIPQSLLISAITDKDAQYFKKALVKNNVIILNNGTDIIDNESFTEQYIYNKWKSNIIIFCGSLNYKPNIQSLQYIFRKIWPTVKKETDLVFYIVGRNPENYLCNIPELDNRVKVIANVRNVLPYYKLSKFLLAPIFTGGGMKNKVLEAFGTATPVITNKEGITGINPGNKITGYLADDTCDIINSVFKMYEADYAMYKELCNNSYWLGKKYSWENAGKKLQTVLNDLYVHKNSLSLLPTQN